MTISLSDLSYVKPKTVTDSGLNGGRMGTATVISGARHSLFPRVTKSERINGVTRYRKEFWKNGSPTDDVAYDVLQWMEVPSNAGDRFYMCEGTHTDIQSDLTTPPAGTVIQWKGVGLLKTALDGGETSVTLTMEANDYVFPNGGFLHITNKIQTSQTIAAGVVPGDSVTYSFNTWQKITSTSDITYPKGVYLGSNNVLSVKETTTEEWLVIAENVYSGESIGTGTGTTSPALSTLTHKTNGICRVVGKLPVVSTLTSGDVELVAYIRQDGSVDTGQGNATAGQLNMATGVWTTPITWTSAPGTGKDITITYRENAYSYTGNDCTIELSDQVANAYLIANTMGAACLYNSEVKPSVSTPVFTGGSNGAFDNATYPIIPHAIGAVRDTITLTFTTTSAYNATGVNLGSIGSGTVGASYTAKNPETNKNMFTITNSAWSGTIQVGDTLVFELYPSSQGVWIKEVVPPGTVQESHNLCILGYYLE